MDAWHPPCITPHRSTPRPSRGHTRRLALLTYRRQIEILRGCSVEPRSPEEAIQQYQHEGEHERTRLLSVSETQRTCSVLVVPAERRLEYCGAVR